MTSSQEVHVFRGFVLIPDPKRLGICTSNLYSLRRSLDASKPVRVSQTAGRNGRGGPKEAACG